MSFKIERVERERQDSRDTQRFWSHSMYERLSAKLPPKIWQHLIQVEGPCGGDTRFEYRIIIKEY